MAKLFLIFIFMPFYIFAKNNDSCLGVVTSHPDMVICIQNNTEKIEKNIKDTIGKDGAKYSLDMSFYNAQRKSISERCSLYNTMGGQRSEFLEDECELEGVSQLSDFLKNYMRAVDNY